MIGGLLLLVADEEEQGGGGGLHIGYVHIYIWCSGSLLVVVRYSLTVWTRITDGGCACRYYLLVVKGTEGREEEGSLFNKYID